MRVLDGPWQEWEISPVPTAVTVGVLDGVHLGHRRLLGHLDRDMTRTVLTFDPHPIEVLRPGTSPRLITTIGERIHLLERVGIECVGVLDLNQIKEQSARTFVAEVLVGQLGVGQMVIGEDFRFGKDRGGDVDLLRQCGATLGFDVEDIGIVELDGLAVSSSRIRDLVDTGDVSGASRLLGSRFTLTNRVVDGDKRGRRIGFPTANLKPPARKLIPAHGVYACMATVSGDTYGAAVNVGVRPTFGGDELLIEAYMLDFDDDIYGRDLSIEFIQYLRPELAFDRVDELIERMGEDVEQTRAILESSGSRI